MTDERFLSQECNDVQMSQGIIYAVQQQAPEMNQVDWIFRQRDNLIEQGYIGIILPEEEHKRHQRDGTFPAQSANFKQNKSARASIISSDTIVSKPAAKLRVDNQQQIQNMVNQPDATTFTVPTENKEQNKRYCICAKQNDNQEYVMCEDECEWYHPECIGFSPTIFISQQVKFVCPYCQSSTKAKLIEGEKKSLYTKEESSKRRNFFVFTPVDQKK